MESQELAQAVLDFVLRPQYQPVKPKVIAKKLGLTPDQSPAVRKAIRRLVKQGKLAYGSKHLVKRPEASRDNRLTGVFRRTLGGFGFVSPPPSQHRDEQPDIYIAAADALDAASGDIVLVRVKKGRRGRNPPGTILEVVERETHRFVGTYFETGGAAYVQVDGKVFSNPVLLGDPGAKRARPDDKIVIEMVRFPSHVHDGEGVIIEVLGPRGEPGVDTLSIIREYNLPDTFAEDALEEARLEAERFDASIPPGRTDLTDLTVITIDPEDARDFDDAISLEPIEGGHWRLGVHIADVSHFVRPKTAIDREARQRGTSVYLPDRVLPMLPEIISNNLASLQPDSVRYTRTAFIEMTADGTPVAADVQAAAIRSDRRFTYEEVDDFQAHPRRWRKELSPQVYQLLQRMFTLARKLRARRFKRGALELSLAEIKIDLDTDGQVSGAHREEQTESHQVIEEFMLAANEATARRLHEAELDFLRRVHESPDPRKQKALTEFVRELGFAVESLESRFELQALLRDVRGRPEEYAVNYALLRSMKRAVYSPAAEGHFALATDCYCHFTSPIRRYPDLLIHRMLDALTRGKPAGVDYGELAVLGEHCSDREQRADAASRELTKSKLLAYMSDRIGEEMQAVITGVAEFGLFAQGLEIPAEGLIHISSLSDDYFRYEQTSHALVGHRSGSMFRLGDTIRVAVARVDLDRRELDFRLLGRLSPKAAEGISRRPAGASPRQNSSPGKKQAASKSTKKRAHRRTKKTGQAVKKKAGAKKGAGRRKKPAAKKPAKKRGSRAKAKRGKPSRSRR